MPARATCSQRRRRKITPVRWRGWAPFGTEGGGARNRAGGLERRGGFAQEGRGGPKDSSAAKAYFQRAAALGDEDAKKALKRIECPYAIKDKRGNFVTNFCF